MVWAVARESATSRRAGIGSGPAGCRASDIGIPVVGGDGSGDTGFGPDFGRAGVPHAFRLR